MGVEEGECGIPDWEEGGGLEQLQSDSNAGMRGIQDQKRECGFWQGGKAARCTYF